MTNLKRLAGFRLPWWIRLLVAVACVVVGVVLIAAPFGGLAALRWLVATSLILTGVSEFGSAAATARPWLTQLIGLAWIVVGIFAAVWPGTTVVSLALLVGIALVIGGAVKLGSVLFGDDDERIVVGINALASIVIGVVALSWPAVTVLILAVIFGLRTVTFGIGQVVLAVKLRNPTTGRSDETPAGNRRWPRPLRWIAAVAAFAIAIAGAVVSYQLHNSGPAAPGAFYTAPSPLPDGPPGTIIRSEVIHTFYDGATTYRVLYKSTGYDGKPTAVSGLVIVPDGPAPSGGSKILAFTHGTVGVASDCGPSLQGPRYISHMEGLSLFVEAGYVVAASDYQGLGTAGPHPYLVGASEGMNELDAVRAAHNLEQAQAGTDFAVWGHSQVGQASLFTGQLASSYAPELNLVGVAAGAPVPNLKDMFEVNIKTNIGKMLISMAVKSWSEVYPDAHLGQIVTPVADAAVSRIAQDCLYSEKQILSSVPSALLLDFTFLSNPPWETEPWKAIIEENNPGQAPTGVPIMLIQGGADTIVAPELTQQSAESLCSSGENVDFRLYPGVGHLDGGVTAAPEVATWIADRFAGKPAPSTCG